MSIRKRSVDECSFRSTVDSETSRCALLQTISGVAQPELCDVPNGACEACCECFPPSVDDPNPIIASLLYQLSDRIVAQDGVPGCEKANAVELIELAMKCMPKTAPNEVDRPAVDIPDYDAGSSQQSLQELVPVEPARHPIRKWAVGVTTAPRRLPTVDDCLDSLINAGWDAPRVFSDGEVPLADHHRELPLTLRVPQLGAWSNFYLSIAELLMREPEADAYLMVQDDALFYNHVGLRTYIEHALWQTDTPGMASLFCPRNYTQPEHGWCDFDGEWVWGAQAFIFSQSAARMFLADTHVVSHRWDPDYQGMFGIDVLIGRWAARCGVPISFPTPSFVQHIGHVSAIWSRAHISGARRADLFAGDLTDGE